MPWSPSGCGDAEVTGDRLLVHQVLQHRDLADRADAPQVPVSSRTAMPAES